MIVNCPHCTKQLKLSDKVRDSLQLLEPGRKIKVKCINCGTPFGLDKTMQPVGPGQKGSSGKGASAPGGVKPPAPQNIEWLKDGTFQDKDVVEDIPSALLLIPESEYRDAVVKAAQTFGYRVEFAADAQEAIEKMRFVNYAAVFLHTEFEPGGIRSGSFHRYMREMNMTRRRYIFYVLIGEQFSTLYDLQAMASSANIVVNNAEIPYIGTVLKKAIPEYEELFGPLMEELQVAGK